MRDKERIKNTISGKITDMIPYSFDMTGVIKEKIAVHYGIKTSEVHNFIGDNLLFIGPSHPKDFTPLVFNEDEYIDEFGVKWNRGKEVHNIGDWGGIVYSPLIEPSVEDYSFPDGKKEGRFDYLDKNMLISSEKYIIAAFTGLFDICWHIRGFEDLLMDFAMEEAFVINLLDKALEYNLGVIGQIPDYVDGIRFLEDWGQQKGLLMGPVFWRKYLKPRLRIMYEAARKRGFNVFIHSCGDISEIFKDIIEIGVEAVNPIQPEVMDVEALKKNYGKDIVLYGGMSCQNTIPRGSIKEVLEEAKKRLDVLGRDGGYIFGPAGSIPTEAKIENVIAIVEFVRNGYK